MTIAAVVVTFNRRNELIKNISMLLRQTKSLDKIFIIDNHGTDKTKELLVQSGLFCENTVEYVYLEENIGGAGGFYEGVKRAYDAGYDLIYLMDDDGRPINKNTLDELLNHALEIYKDNKLLFINSLVVGDEAGDGELSFGLGSISSRSAAEHASQNGIIIGLANPFNGTLISKELVEQIGYPNKDFFIRGDEIDYNLRAKNANAYIATVVSSLYYHPKANYKYFRILWKKCKTEVIGAPWKLYYSVRNKIYSLISNHSHGSKIKILIFNIITTIRFEKHKLKCLKMVFKGYRDGVKGILGKRDDLLK